MNLTHKAIARMAGYRVYFSDYGGRYPVNWRDVDDETNIGEHYINEEEAYKACCIENGLTNED